MNIKMVLVQMETLADGNQGLVCRVRTDGSGPDNEFATAALWRHPEIGKPASELAEILRQFADAIGRMEDKKAA